MQLRDLNRTDLRSTAIAPVTLNFTSILNPSKRSKAHYCLAAEVSKVAVLDWTNTVIRSSTSNVTTLYTFQSIAYATGRRVFFNVKWRMYAFIRKIISFIFPYFEVKFLLNILLISLYPIGFNEQAIQNIKVWKHYSHLKKHPF